MSALQPANPRYGVSVSMALTTGSTSATIPQQVGGSGQQQVQLLNNSPNVIFVRIGKGAQTASLTSPNADFPIGPNAAVIITKAQDDDTVAVISASASGTLWITPVTGW